MKYSKTTFNASHSGIVSWDDGLTWIPFNAGDVEGTPIENGTGEVQIKSVEMSHIKFLSNTYKDINITKAETLTSAEEMCYNLSNLETFNIASGNQFLTLQDAWSGCSSLTCISGVDTRNAISTTNMFFNTPSLLRPNSDEQTTIENGVLWINDTPCPDYYN